MQPIISKLERTLSRYIYVKFYISFLASENDIFAVVSPFYQSDFSSFRVSGRGPFHI